MFGLAAMLCFLIAGVAVMNVRDGRPPRATWVPAFALIGGVTAIVLIGTVIGLLLD